MINIKHSKKGYVLAITVIVTFVLVITAVTILGVIYRYSNTISKDLLTLRETVKDYKDLIS